MNDSNNKMMMIIPYSSPYDRWKFRTKLKREGAVYGVIASAAFIFFSSLTALIWIYL